MGVVLACLAHVVARPHPGPAKLLIGGSSMGHLVLGMKNLVEFSVK